MILGVLAYNVSQFSKGDARESVFILGRGIAGIPHFRKKSPKLTETVRDKSPTFTPLPYDKF